ncbi:Peptidylprolyl isomerase [Hymenobacter roseosalivarius DSM 11622]|uniref:Peptidyl-prolyl cis-trans isomerase n=1 Tax=Hymenobacter roseosalivarius DSM 11622 TaxID=645990 RepID=A0A1W1V2W3_9BACT|nr:FKBP-type peptidyl-prolyl cis-trans isomerase [Hymenobacter roseosalivarius]SMB87616.1 Peptidylprolyl isomerase [Hymenobacter roseosalivarius DSM 11622]
MIQLLKRSILSRLAVFLLASVPLLTACEKETDYVKKDEKIIQEYIAQNTIVGAQRQESGLYYVPTVEGTGAKAKPGQTVSVHYVGTLLNGQEFDNSVKRGKPIEFQLGVRQVIAGWDEGIALMNQGGKATLLIPSSLGYGANGAGGVIPPNAVLRFDVELVSVK